MKRKLFYLIICVFTSIATNAQTISIVGEAVGGWPDTDPNTPDTQILSTTDNITYTLTNLSVSTAAVVNGGVKFRRDGAWDINWGGTTFPSGQGVQNGPNIPTLAGVYDVTFNITNGTYTFIGTIFPSIGIWGPAVNSQLGYAAPDIDMTTSDGITYTLSGFYFSSGNAYFRQDDATINVWGSTQFPTGTAVLNGPSLFIPSNEWFVTFNRITGAYSFSYPSVGILGTALNGFTVEDTDLFTDNGFGYSIPDLVLANGTVKFRKDNSWTTNWGALGFPTGIGTQNGPDIPVTAGTYNITFDKSTGNYDFSNTLTNARNSISNVNIYPNPSNSIWHLTHTNTIDSILLYDTLGKLITQFEPNATQFELDGTSLREGIYIVKVVSGLDFAVQKIIKN
jgi:hypothetical protein